MPDSVAVARQPLELKSLVRIQAGQPIACMKTLALNCLTKARNYFESSLFYAGRAVQLNNPRVLVKIFL